MNPASNCPPTLDGTGQALSGGRLDKDAFKKRSWEALVEARTSGRSVFGTVRGAIKGGLLVDLPGKVAFLPASQCGQILRNYVARVSPIETLIGQTCGFKVIDVDVKHHRAIVSLRAHLEELLKARKVEALAELKIGSIYEGVVARLFSYGAFVDLGAIDGLLHNTGLTYHPISRPHDHLIVGEVVPVQVIGIDHEKLQVKLSRRYALPHPWDGLDQTIVEGRSVIATVLRDDRGTIRVAILPHIEAIARKKPEHRGIFFNDGDEVEVRITRVDRDNLQIRAVVAPVTSGGRPWPSSGHPQLQKQIQSLMASRSAEGALV
jgi:small subunit ribosomal protein S1